MPEGEHGDSQRDDQRRQHAGEALEDFGENDASWDLLKKSKEYR